ncbi:MAG: hypothetical protein AAGG51_16330 [Cyanobacteria bacterium P01_G01_bin.54]
MSDSKPSATDPSPLPSISKGEIPNSEFRIPNSDPYGERPLQRLMMFLYLVPGFGIFPALWTLYRRQGSRRQQQVSRVAVGLGLAWFITYGGLGLGAEQMSDIARFRLLFLNGMATTGYVVFCLSLMLRVWRNQSVRLPGLGQERK